ncbi:Pyrimidine 5'-nucleotidase YjjG [compost metagenome]
MFTSEQFQSYKNDENNIMFKEMLKFYNADPSKVLHIGDSVSDIVGANREGITTCWLNRNKRTWEHQVKPDYVIESLNDLEGIL